MVKIAVVAGFDGQWKLPLPIESELPFSSGNWMRAFIADNNFHNPARHCVEAG